jgi:hypothetical protein
MNRFTIIALIIMAFGLFRDFKRDKGENNKAKIFHSILLTFLIWAFAGSFGKIGWLIRNFDKTKKLFGTEVGILSGNFNLITFYLNLVLSLIVLVFAYQMINRKENARKKLLIFLPFLAITSVFQFYISWLKDGDDALFNDSIILLIGAVVIGTITFIYLKVYGSNFMKTFFNYKPEAKEEIINEIGTE